MNSGRITKQTLEGGITVFLSLILTCICALLGGLFESARVAGCGWYMQLALDSSLDSLMSGYHREVWEQYRLFVLEFEDQKGLEAGAERFCSVYFEAAPFYPLTNSTLKIEEPVRITDAGGDFFEQEILDYMKYGIWNQETDAAVLGELADTLTEAGSIHKITEQYQEDARNVLKLEQAVERIGECLKKQERYLEEANTALRNGNGSRFFSSAANLIRELERIPKLVEVYEKEAENLREKLADSEEKAENYRGDLREESWLRLKTEIDSCRSYIDKEGEQYKEIMATRDLAAGNKNIIEAAIRKAEEVQEYINSWEPDDDEDELDEEALWRSVLPLTNRFQRDERFKEPGIKDKKKMNMLEAIGRMAGGDLLSVCVPEGTELSDAIISDAELPSQTGSKSQKQGRGLANEILDQALLNEYAAAYFTSFMTEDQKEFQYEQEYLLNGALSDRENLKQTVNQVIAVREAMNLLYLLGNADMRQEAQTLALTITGASGMAPLTAVVFFLILTIWAFAESVQDVRILLHGGKVPILKSGQNWSISLSGLVEHGAAIWTDAPNTSQESGLDYQGWIKLFFLVEEKTLFLYRMMDMIQVNICRTQPEFRMKQCAYRLEASLEGQSTLIPIRRRAAKEY